MSAEVLIVVPTLGRRPEFLSACLNSILNQDVEVDIVIVYKVDRLTRALADFARMVAIFDAAGVSFVSVTQQFNTTTSMGRFTLNMLCRLPSSSGRSPASAFGTRSRRQRPRACGWAACRR